MLLNIQDFPMTPSCLYVPLTHSCSCVPLTPNCSCVPLTPSCSWVPLTPRCSYVPLTPRCSYVPLTLSIHKFNMTSLGDPVFGPKWPSFEVNWSSRQKLWQSFLIKDLLENVAFIMFTGKSMYTHEPWTITDHKICAKSANMS